VDLAKINTIDISSLEQLQTELIKQGFEPVDQDLRAWAGPVFSSFSNLTDAEEMKIVFQDGWPFLHPKVFVPGLDYEHVNAHNEVCLWRDDDGSMDWVTLDGIRSKVDQWCAHADKGFRDEDMVLDAHLYYENAGRRLVLLDINNILGEEVADGSCGNLYAHDINKDCIRIDTLRRNCSGRVALYYRSNIHRPPHNIDSFYDILHSKQKKDYDRRLVAIKKRHRDAINYIVLIWSYKNRYNVQIINISIDKNFRPISQALVAAPLDEQYLSLRAGQQFETLNKYKIAIFGVGAIGSHVSMLLCKMGTGVLKIIDNGLIRPSHVVRHIANIQDVGLSKASVVKKMVKQNAPWTEVEVVEDISWAQEKLKELCQEVDLIVDATGYNSFAQNLSSIADSIGKQFISASLFKAGNVARIRYQPSRDDTPIYKRIVDDRYPIIPFSQNETAGLEPGCSSPVINAPPQSVYGISALTCQVISDIFMGKEQAGFDLIQVCSGDGKPPFDRVGIFKF